MAYAAIRQVAEGAEILSETGGHEESGGDENGFHIDEWSSGCKVLRVE